MLMHKKLLYLSLPGMKRRVILFVMHDFDHGFS